MLGRPLLRNEYDYRMAPRFDHGSSLSYGETDGHLARLPDLDGYIWKGRHHCGWAGPDSKGGRHVELCGKFAESFHVSGHAREFVIRFTSDAIADVLVWCRTFGGAIEFSALRADFLHALLNRRRELLVACCE